MLASHPVHPGRMTSNGIALSRRAWALRGVHAGIAAVELAGLGYVWGCALTGRGDRLLRICVGTLAGEGIALVIGRDARPSVAATSRI
jgi:hypothetical protein